MARKHRSQDPMDVQRRIEKRRKRQRALQSRAERKSRMAAANITLPQLKQELLQLEKKAAKVEKERSKKEGKFGSFDDKGKNGRGTGALNPIEERRREELREMIGDLEDAPLSGDEAASASDSDSDAEIAADAAAPQSSTVFVATGPDAEDDGWGAAMAAVADTAAAAPGPAVAQPQRTVTPPPPVSSSALAPYAALTSGAAQTTGVGGIAANSASAGATSGGLVSTRDGKDRTFVPIAVAKRQQRRQKEISSGVVKASGGGFVAAGAPQQAPAGAGSATPPPPIDAEAPGAGQSSGLFAAFSKATAPAVAAPTASTGDDELDALMAEVDAEVAKVTESLNAAEGSAAAIHKL